jgi:MFS transporter, ACS family, hexuronate transporter
MVLPFLASNRVTTSKCKAKALCAANVSQSRNGITLNDLSVREMALVLRYGGSLEVFWRPSREAYPASRARGEGREHFAVGIHRPPLAVGRPHLGNEMKIPGFRWVIAGLLFGVTLLAYLDVQEMSVLAPILTKQIGMSSSQYAFVTQAFLVAYTFTFLLGGLVIDKLGVRWGLGLSMFFWSIANTLHALANTPNELATCRFLLGLAYPGAFVAAARAVSEWYPVQERAFVYGLSVSGATSGAMVAYPMVTWMATHWGWHAPFLVTGGIGILLSPVWLIVYQPPERHPWVREKEREYIKIGRPTEEQESGWRWTSLLKTRTFWAVGIGRSISDSIWVFYVIWLAKFLTEAQGLSIQQVGRLGWIPFLFADAGFIGGGWLSGRLIRRGMTARRARLALLTATTLVRSFTFLLIIRYPTPVLILLVGIFVLCTTAWQVNLSVMLVDSFPPRIIATASGLTTSFGTTSTIIFTWAVGWIVQHYSYRPVFVLLSVLSLAAYFVVLLILGGTGTPAGQDRSIQVLPSESAASSSSV